MDIEVHCVWHCHTLLSALLSLQAYAVQGQHAIPQPDVSEGPSVSDPIYLQVRSWETIPPSYFIPLTPTFPTSTVSLRHPFNDSTDSSLLNININVCFRFTINHGSYVPFHIFLSLSPQSLLKGVHSKISAFKCLFLGFSSPVISVCLLLLSFCPLYQQLTKLHQLAMQQSPFPIAHSNQGFQGR